MSEAQEIMIIPKTPDEFVAQNFTKIKRVFPDLISEDLHQKQLASDVWTNLENGVWGAIGDDPVMARLGRENYDRLPFDRRLPIVEKAINLLDSAKQVQEFLAKK